MSDFTGKVAVVTGGASGMGAAVVTELANRGAAILVVDRDEAGAAGVAEATRSGDPLIGDVSESGFAEAAIAEAVSRHGALHLLVNAAGIIARANAVDTTDDDWLRMFDVNVHGIFRMSRAAVPELIRAGGGAIVNFGSIWGDVATAGHAAYCATKGAVHQLTRAMALDHARDGIRVNAVCPGEIDTPMLASGRPSGRPPEDVLADLADRTVPMGRLGRPEEVARVVAFLGSDAASYMTGSMVTVDAGYTAR